MTDETNTVSAGGVATPAPGRPARSEDPERGERDAESVLSLTSGAGPKQLQEDCMASPRHPARPVRFDDPARNAAYWARIDAIVDEAPPLEDWQRAAIRSAFHQPASAREAA
ncbi:hypothetical protein ACFUTV_38825 [Streptomyces sp. NPDC057298]|uniref:hypothetical protein n=1 Tax=Streptomyces sp. NPDC057298 TaxID=3346091 RepID=UPI003639570B